MPRPDAVAKKLILDWEASSERVPPPTDFVAFTPNLTADSLRHSQEGLNSRRVV